MSNVQNLPVPLKIVDAFLASMEAGVDGEEQSRAALAMIDAVKKARKALADGHNRPELTVCRGKLGYVDPKDVDRFLRDEIPRLTVYRKKKDARNMGAYFQRPPKFYRDNQKCKTQTRATLNTTTGTRKRPAKQNASSGPKPKTS